MTTQELVERLQSWAVDFDGQSETVDGGLHRHIFQLRAQVARAAASRLSEMEGEIKRLDKERAYAVRWSEGAVESVKEVMWRYEDALKRIAEMDAHQSSSGWDMSRIARAALEHQQKETK